MGKTRFEIPPPRGEQFRFLGIRPSLDELSWIEAGPGIDRFREEVEATVRQLNNPELVGHWRNLIADMDRLGKEISSEVYAALLKKIPKARFFELVHDEYKFERDTFISLLESHARFFFTLIPEVGSQVARYDRTLDAFACANAELAGHLYRAFPETAGEPDARSIVIRRTIDRLKGGTHVE